MCIRDSSKVLPAAKVFANVFFLKNSPEKLLQIISWFNIVVVSLLRQCAYGELNPCTGNSIIRVLNIHVSKKVLKKIELEDFHLNVRL